jgi:hypothetical protein
MARTREQLSEEGITEMLDEQERQHIRECADWLCWWIFGSKPKGKL